MTHLTFLCLLLMKAIGSEYTVNFSDKSIIFLDGEVQTIQCPAFAESISDGDVKWEKGMQMNAN